MFILIRIRQLATVKPTKNVKKKLLFTFFIYKNRSIKTESKIAKGKDMYVIK